ncbi:MAG TPA: UDP-glucose/GDP-mannose dehydrogenase family protein [bacterium]|jgi:UDPglucose 6-dehydrogenase
MVSGAGSTEIAIVGLGHVGLPTALGFAEIGWQVVGMDSMPERVAMVADGRAPFFEPDLQGLLDRHHRSGRFHVTDSLPEAVARAQVLFVCVSTPQLPDGAADLSAIEHVARTIAANVDGYALVVDKSTTPVRTAERMKWVLSRYHRGSHEVEVAVNPEFLQEGNAVHDVLHPDRIVLGVESDRARTLLTELYRPLLDRLPAPGECAVCDRRGTAGNSTGRLITTNLETAELIKHSANSFLATKISFMNMVADLCEVTGADVSQVARGIGLDPRIGSQFLGAGVGFGGSCLPKDLRAFIRIADDHRVDFSLLKDVAAINERRIDRLLEKVRTALWIVKDKTLAILGLSFKPGTDDVRDAASTRIVPRLLAEGAHVRLYDPHAMDAFAAVVPPSAEATYCGSPYEAAEGAHAVVLLTEWDQFRALDLDRLRAAVALPIIIDGRNMLDPATARSHGFDYMSFGRP